MMWYLLQATVTSPPQASSDSGIGPISVVINSLWILFALAMIAVALFFFRRWDRRARFSAQESTITAPSASGTLATSPQDVAGTPAASTLPMEERKRTAMDGSR